MSLRVKRFLISASLLFLAIEFYRLYMLYRVWTRDKLISRHFILALVSVLISAYILKIGIRGNDQLKKDARFLVSGGAALTAIWSYRFYLIFRTVKNPLIRKGLTYVSLTYIILSLLIMAAGLRIIKDLGLRREDKII